MADHFLAAALKCARGALARTADPAADDHLLDRFVRDRDEAAFAELVARHGPVVWAACRRGAATAADAEDAFQATFLVLVRRAGRVRRAAAGGGWLFRVAVRLAARTRARAIRSAGPARPAADPSPDPADRAAWRDLVAVLDAELAGLPDAVRAALVCCYYEGLTQDEAARRLGWKVRTVRARVARGRSVLRARLARRGVDLGAALAAAAAGTDTAAGPPAVGPVVPADGSVVGSPAVAALVRDGLALTGRAVPVRLAVGVAVVVAAGVGCVLAVGPDWAPAGGTDGPPVAVAPPAGVPEPPADPRAAVDPVAVYDRAVDGCVYIVNETPAGRVEGSGVLIDRDQRLVLTTYRVVGDSDVVSVQFPFHNPDGTVETDRAEYARSAAAKLTPVGRVVRRDKARGLALVRLDRLGRHARALELAEPGVRKAVLHIGSGTGHLFPMIVRTIVPATATEPDKARAITLSGATDDSGGPLIDKDGRLAGVVAGPGDRAVTLGIDVAEVRAFLAEKDTETPDPPAKPVVKNFGPPANRIPRDLGTVAESNSKDFDAVALYEKCVRSTVFIVKPLVDGHAEGSGSVIDVEKRYVLTTYDVVSEVDYVFVQFPVRLKDGTLMTDKKKYIERIPAGQALKGKVLFRDKTRDLALIQLDRLPPDTPALPLAKKGPRVGEFVINIGNPGKVNQTFSTTRGTVRAVMMEDIAVRGGGEPLRLKARMVTVSNPINPGDSGGPLIDNRGYQVGVTVSALGAAENVNLCIDATEVRDFLAEKKVFIKDPTGEKGGRDPISGPDREDRTPDPPRTGLPPLVDPPPLHREGAPAEDEQAAAKALSRARLFAEGDDNRPTYRAKLKEVIARFPGTKAAQEAKKTLDSLK